MIRGRTPWSSADGNVTAVTGEAQFCHFYDFCEDIADDDDFEDGRALTHLFKVQRILGTVDNNVRPCEECVEREERRR